MGTLKEDRRQLGKQRAEQLRRNQTPAERAFREALKRTGILYKRQQDFCDGHVLFICDFVLTTPKGLVVVEIDGPDHQKPVRVIADEARTSWLLKHGVSSVVRFTNAQVQGNIASVIEQVKRLSPTMLAGFCRRCQRATEDLCMVVNATGTYRHVSWYCTGCERAMFGKLVPMDFVRARGVALETLPMVIVGKLKPPVEAPPVVIDGPFLVTEHWIRKHSTRKGGWLLAQLRTLGEPSFAKGWLRRSIGKRITTQARIQFEALGRGVAEQAPDGDAPLWAGHVTPWEEG